ncbi:hypothetical protein GGX14DRAFT_579935 [Mycena pura]|uniref:Uncharacterized protein n=1 Tax=Mycena pura TaxID=153505 RepID=A0AAD6Y1M6_9AGAR|nr:hypothetical protein GGX14DRAFT_579935 [Mycena pura]
MSFLSSPSSIYSRPETVSTDCVLLFVPKSPPTRLSARAVVDGDLRAGGGVDPGADGCGGSAGAGGAGRGATHAPPPRAYARARRRSRPMGRANGHAAGPPHSPPHPHGHDHLHGHDRAPPGGQGFRGCEYRTFKFLPDTVALCTPPPLPCTTPSLPPPATPRAAALAPPVHTPMSVHGLCFDACRPRRLAPPCAGSLSTPGATALHRRPAPLPYTAGARSHERARTRRLVPPPPCITPRTLP